MNCMSQSKQSGFKVQGRVAGMVDKGEWIEVEGVSGWQVACRCPHLHVCAGGAQPPQHTASRPWFVVAPCMDWVGDGDLLRFLLRTICLCNNCVMKKRK